jgi:hypothetical protein
MQPGNCAAAPGSSNIEGLIVAHLQYVDLMLQYALNWMAYCCCLLLLPPRLIAAAAVAAAATAAQDDTFFALVEYKYKSKVLGDPRVK